MRQIRKNVFETNSSSTHSLVLFKHREERYTHDEMYKELEYHIRDGIYKPWDELYFGRYPFRVLTSFQDKLHYAYANTHGVTEKVNEVTEVLSGLVPEVWGFEPEDEYMGVDETTLPYWLKELGITLEEFLVNKKYAVICDGDEYCIWEDLKEKGIINTAAIEKEIDI